MYDCHIRSNQMLIGKYISACVDAVIVSHRFVNFFDRYGPIFAVLTFDSGVHILLLYRNLLRLCWLSGPIRDFLSLLECVLARSVCGVWHTVNE